MRADGRSAVDIAKRLNMIAGPASWAPSGNWITFSGARKGERNVGIYVVRPNSTGLKRLTSRKWEAQYPAWSPDGEKIAFASGRDEDEEIYVMNADGTEQKRLTDIPGPDHWPPTWSPDNTRIAFTSDGTQDNSEIYVMNADGSGLTKLTDDPAYDTFPAWRP